MRSIVALVVVGCCSLAAAQTLSPAVQAFVKVNAPVVALTGGSGQRDNPYRPAGGTGHALPTLSRAEKVVMST